MPFKYFSGERTRIYLAFDARGVLQISWKISKDVPRAINVWHDRTVQVNLKISFHGHSNLYLTFCLIFSIFGLFHTNLYSQSILEEFHNSLLPCEYPLIPSRCNILMSTIQLLYYSIPSNCLVVWTEQYSSPSSGIKAVVAIENVFTTRVHMWTIQTVVAC